jgi:hypothetical protein
MRNADCENDRRDKLSRLQITLLVEVVNQVGVCPKSKNKEESHLGDSLDHQGASTTLSITYRGEGCHPLFGKKLMNLFTGAMKRSV